jgi:hypothetical protein
VKVCVRVVAWPLGRVVVAVRVPVPPETDVTTLRPIVAPEAVVIVPCLSQVPGACLVSVPEYVKVFPFERVMVPLSENEPGAVFAAVPCQAAVVPLGLVAVPLTVPVFVCGFQVRWDCQLPVPPAALVQVPWVFAEPLERVVVADAVPVPPAAFVQVPLRVTCVSSDACAVFAKAISVPAMIAAAT